MAFTTSLSFHYTVTGDGTSTEAVIDLAKLPGQGASNSNTWGLEYIGALNNPYPNSAAATDNSSVYTITCAVESSLIRMTFDSPT